VKADGSTAIEDTQILKRAPIRASSYSPAERFTIVELALMYFIDRDKHLHPGQFSGPFHTQLKITRSYSFVCLYGNSARHRSKMIRIDIDVNDLSRRLTDLGYLEAVPAKWGTKYWGRKLLLQVTPKGQRHIKRQSKRLRSAARKLIYTSVLDRLALAVC
jgi:hypothetical protein